jgi:hypothetical protein
MHNFFGAQKSQPRPFFSHFFDPVMKRKILMHQTVLQFSCKSAMYYNTNAFLRSFLLSLLEISIDEERSSFFSPFMFAQLQRLFVQFFPPRKLISLKSSQNKSQKSVCMKKS